MVLLTLGLTGFVHGQISRAFPDGVLLPNAQSRPAAIAAANTTAVILAAPYLSAEGALVHERGSGGTWSLVQTIPGVFSTVAIDSTGTQFAIAHGGTIDFYSRSVAGTWLLSGTIPLGSGISVSKLALEGARMVALINTGIGGEMLGIYDYNGLDWVLKKGIGIASSLTAPPETVSVVTDFALSGTRLAVSSLAEGCIRIHEIDQGGAGQWGLVREITTATAGVSALGNQVALHGERLAAVTDSGTQRRIDVFSRNQGGANQWGMAGTLATVDATTIGEIALQTDVSSGRLAALGLPNSGSTLGSYAAGPFLGPCHLWVFANTPGAGIGQWSAAADMPVGPVNGFKITLPGLGFAGDDLIHGLGPLDPAGLAAMWLASVHRRNTGGTDAWQLQQILAGPGIAASCGRALANYGRYVAVGMPNDSSAGVNSGSVMVWYQQQRAGGSTWLPCGRFQAPAPVAGARFGSSVAVMDGVGYAWLAVGAPGENSDHGAVYLFAINSFYPASTAIRLAPPDPDYNTAEAFGSSVAFAEGLQLAVGAPADDAASSNAGAVYLFEKDRGGTEAWGQLKKLNRPLGETLTGFGSSVVFGTHHLAVALPPAAASQGKIFIFTQDTGGVSHWGSSVTISAPSACPPGFASALAAFPGDGKFAVGAPGSGGDSKAGIAEVPGKAYIFHLNDGVFTTLTTLAELGGSSAEGYGFGSALAIHGTRVVVGNPNFGSGKTFTYDVTDASPRAWSLLHAREAALAGDGLGSAVATSDIFTLSAAPGSDLAGTNAGALIVDRSGTYEVWAANQGPGFTQWLPDQDPDGDGLGNLMEFGFGSNPLAAASRPAFAMDFTTFTNATSSWPAMRWSPPTLSYSATLLDYQMEGSPDLDAWSTVSPAGGLSPGDPPGWFFRLTTPRAFFRLHLLYPSEVNTDGERAFVVP